MAQDGTISPWGKMQELENISHKQALPTRLTGGRLAARATVSHAVYSARLLRNRTAALQAVRHRHSI